MERDYITIPLIISDQEDQLIEPEPVYACIYRNITFPRIYICVAGAVIIFLIASTITGSVYSKVY